MLRRHKRFFELGAYLVATAAFCLVAVVETNASSLHIDNDSISVSTFPSARSIGGFLGTANSSSTLRVPVGQNSYDYETQRYTPSLHVNAVGVRLNGSELKPDSLELSLDIVDSQGKGIKRMLTPTGEDAKEPLPKDVYISTPVMVKDVASFSLHVRLLRNADGSSPVITSLEIIYLDSTFSPLNTFFTMAETDEVEEEVGVDTSEATPAANPHIITREEWGADEDLRFTKKGKERWPSVLDDVDVFIVHHTAGTDGGEDPSATVRAIYFWHATVMGWGDIGYNYLIDPQGNIYEGRAGGSGVIGGHTFNSDNGINYNEGSIGIALLGCFEDTPGACYDDYIITPEMKKSLELLIGTRAAELHINPKSKTEFHGEETKRVVGHRDLDATYCPGNVVHDNLSVVRKRAKKKYTALTRVPYKGTYTTMTLDEMFVDGSNIEAKDEHLVTITYTNTGDKLWERSKAYLKIYNGQGKGLSPLAHASWTNGYGQFQMNEEVVAPGEDATFTFLIAAPEKATTVALTAKLFHGNSKVLKTNNTASLPFVRAYEGELTQSTMPVALLRNTSQEVDFTFTNTGTTTWDASVHLLLDGTVVGTFKKAKVAPGEKGTLSIDLPAPKRSNTPLHYVTVELEQGDHTIPATKTVFLMRVD